MRSIAHLMPALIIRNSVFTFGPVASRRQNGVAVPQRASARARLGAGMPPVAALGGVSARDAAQRAVCLLPARRLCLI
jgi:hypothetical protein